MIITCPKCGNNTFIMNDNPSGLVSWKKKPDGNIDIKIDTIFPVRAYFCSSCKYVELKYENPNQA